MIVTMNTTDLKFQFFEFLLLGGNHVMCTCICKIYEYKTLSYALYAGRFASWEKMIEFLSVSFVFISNLVNENIKKGLPLL